MNADQPSRRLAAILVADVAGYSALMGVDEAGTVAALKGHQAVILPMISAQGGRVIDTAGDGILAEFQSVVAAVHCAIALQAAMAERNGAVVSERRMDFRIGINQGDVVYDDARIYGDGINIAARLQALAEPGGILVSGKVFEEVRDRVDAGFRDLGEKALNNIARPVRVFAVVPGSADEAATEPAKAEAAPSIMVPSVAVLPFANLSSDLEQEYFADGVVDDIITALSRFKSFAVIARNSSFTYKGRSVDVRQVAKELDVRYVLEGSVRKSGNQLRIAAQLLDGTTGAHIWAQNFDGILDDIFAFQDRITESVVGIVEPQVQRAELARALRERPGSVAAYDLYLRTLAIFTAMTDATNRAGYNHLVQALKLEPDNASYMALAVDLLQHRFSMGWPPIGPDDAATCMDLVTHALAAAGDNAMVLAICGNAFVQRFRNYDRGVDMIRRAVEINPNNFFVVALAGVAQLHCGDPEEAIALFNRATRLNPLDATVALSSTGIAYTKLVQGDYEEAIAWARKSLAINPRYDPTFWVLAAANAHLGRLDEARKFREELQRLAPKTTIASIRAGQPAKFPDRIEPIIEGLRLAGLPES